MAITYINGPGGAPAPSWLTANEKTRIDNRLDGNVAFGWASGSMQALPRSAWVYYITGYYVNNGAVGGFAMVFESEPQNVAFPELPSLAYWTPQTTPFRAYTVSGSNSIISAAQNVNNAPYGYFVGTSFTFCQGNTTTVYIAESTIPFTMNGEPWTPTIPDYRFFNKLYDSYTLSVGVAVDENSEAQPHYYITKDYKINLRWTSLKSGTSYSYPLSSLKKQVISEVQFTEEDLGKFAFNYVTEIGDIARGLRIPEPGTYVPALIPTSYEDLQDIRSYNEVTLTELVNYMQTQDAGTTEQDIFTEIFADFIVNNEVIETKSVSYSSLFGTEDIDISGGTVQDPNGQPSIDDTNVYTDEVDLTVPTLTGTGVFNRCYVLDANGVNDLCDYLYNADDSIFDEIIDGVLTRGNPIESLIDLRLYPFDVRTFTGAGTAESIKFGRTDTEIIGTKLPHNANAVISLGSAVVPRYYNSFLDYQMTVKLYIPFCGVCDLPVDRVLNHEISIKLIVDYVTGACTAVVFVDKLPLMYQPGVIGVSIPMTATNSAEFGKAIIGNLVTGAKSAASGDAAKAADAALGTASALWEGSHIQSVGSSSPQTALYQPKNAYLLMSIVTPPEGVYDTTYANNIGYACFMPMNQIGFMDGTGFVAFDNVKLDIPQATEAEKAELLQLLKAGVFM